MYESVRYHLEQIQYQSEITWDQVDAVFSDLSSQQIVLHRLGVNIWLFRKMYK